MCVVYTLERNVIHGLIIVAQKICSTRKLDQRDQQASYHSVTQPSTAQRPALMPCQQSGVELLADECGDGFALVCGLLALSHQAQFLTIHPANGCRLLLFEVVYGSAILPL